MAAAGGLAVILLALTPLAARAWPLPVLLIFLCSPLYMLHQVEEHHGDRFRRFVNARLFGGVTAMTAGDVLLVNVGLVWGLNALALLAALILAPGYGLVAGYAMLVNAAGHIALAVRQRAYNPGLLTAAFGFVPLGAAVVARVPSTGAQHLGALTLALALHLLIAASALRRARLAPVGGQP